ncbi:MAG: nucleotidyl transferase AbiEii/AbiGii toxin family protein [Rhodospirillales bacterium]|nr:nucleotidyl transferase AbiEii/AbiGii toxin family protein [Rhodospirillales bacterium]
MMEAFEQPFHGIRFGVPDDSYYETQDGLSLGVDPIHTHDWNPDGQSQIRLQVSRREVPTLPPSRNAQRVQSYFRHLFFDPVDITCLALPEIIAEKIRACYQRSKARDIYDLSVFATRPLNRPLARRLVVLKLWQARDAFDPEAFFEKLADASAFDWEDLRQLVRRPAVSAPAPRLATTPAPRLPFRGGGGRPVTRHRSPIRATTASSGSGSSSLAMIPSPGPNARPDGTRICNSAFPSSALSTNRPSRSLSPSTRAPASASIPSSGAELAQGSGSGSPISIGTPDQKGERQISARGSSQASSAHAASASRSASVWSRTGMSACSKRGGPACAAQASR